MLSAFKASESSAECWKTNTTELQSRDSHSIGLRRGIGIFIKKNKQTKKNYPNESDVLQRLETTGVKSMSTAPKYLFRY